MRPRKNQRGQVAVFYALLIPIFLLVGGVGLDLGWYYLNVSRLQNAADAAVIVGAKALLSEIKYNDTEKTLKEKGYKVKLVEQYPANSLAKDASGNVIATTTGDQAVRAYVEKNLASDSTAYKTPNFFSVAEAAEAQQTTGTVTEATTTGPPYTLTDGYSKGGKTQTVTLTPTLYQDGENYYYVVSMSEDVDHFFIGYLDAMNAGVTAVALISKNIDNGGGGGGDNPEDKGTVELAFDANEGYFNNDPNVTSVTKEITSPSKMGDNEVIELTSGKGTPTRPGYEFAGWSTTKWDPTQTTTIVEQIVYIKDTEQLTKTDLENLFGGLSSVTLFAIWIDTSSENPNNPTPKPENNKTLWEQMQYLVAKNVYPYYWYSAINKYGENTLVNNRFNNVKAYPSEINVTTTQQSGYWTYSGRNKKYTEILQTTYNSHMKSYGYYNDNGTPRELYKEKSSWGITHYYYISNSVWHEPEEVQNVITSNDRNYYAEAIDLGADKSDGENSYNRSDIATSTHYFLDFWQEGQSSQYKDINGKGISGERSNMKIYRIHSLFNVNKTFPVRSGYGEDPLYCRIEAEPYKSEQTAVRQIVININVDNISKDEDGNECRPLFIFYDGPDARSTQDSSGVSPGDLTPTDAQPVILNLNANFKGVLFMPDIPVVINGNGNDFEGFIIAKEFHYLDTEHGNQVRYSSKGERDKYYSDNDIHVGSKGNVLTIQAEGTDAKALWNNGNNVFGLGEDSHFRKFSIDSGVNYAYLHYGFENLMLDETAFYDDINKQLVPLYTLDSDGKEVRVTKWEKVNLYGKPRFDDNGQEIPERILIPKVITSTDDVTTIKKLVGSNQSGKLSKVNDVRGIVLLDNDNNPIPVYDEAGNDVYFCKSYMDLVGSYSVLTLDKMDDTTDNTAEGMRSRREFLLTKTEASNVSNTSDWT